MEVTYLMPSTEHIFWTCLIGFQGPAIGSSIGDMHADSRLSLCPPGRLIDGSFGIDQRFPEFEICPFFCSLFIKWQFLNDIHITAPPPPHSTPAPASHSTPRRPSPAPPASGRLPSPSRRRRTGRFQPSSDKTSGGREPPGAAAPSRVAYPSSNSRSRGTSLHRPVSTTTSAAGCRRGPGFVLLHREGVR